METTGKGSTTLRRIGKALRKGRTLSLVLLALVLPAFFGLKLGPAAPAFAQDREECGASEPGVAFLCGLVGVEDLILLDEGRWIVGSSLPHKAAKGPPLYLFDAAGKAAIPIAVSDIAVHPDAATFPHCPGAPDFTRFASSGLGYRVEGGQRTLYVVNYGGREAIEVFSVDMRGAKPVLQWTGCVVAPDHVFPDAVAALPDGGIVVTSLWDPLDQERFAKLGAGRPMGSLAEWHPASGWKAIGPAGLSGPNGVIASADGRTLFVAAWSGRQILRIDRATGAFTSVDVDFLPDNLRWGPGGADILVGGQVATVERALACFESAALNCDIPFTIGRVDPATLKTVEIVKRGVHGAMGAGTGAIQVGNELWVGSYRADRIARFPVDPPR